MEEKDIDDLFSSIFDTIKENPVISAITGLGLFLYWQKERFFLTMQRLQLMYGQSLFQWAKIIGQWLIVLLILRLIWKGCQYVFAKKRFCYALILPHEQDTFAYKQIITMVRSFYYIPQPWRVRFLIGKARYSFVMKKDEEGKVFYYLGGDQALIHQAIATFTAANYKHAEAFMVRKEDPFLSPETKGRRFGFHLRPAKKASTPFQRFTYDCSTVLAQQLPENACIQITFENVQLRKFRKMMNEEEKEIQLITTKNQAKEKMNRQKELQKDLGKRFESDEVIYKTWVGVVGAGKESKNRLFNCFNTLAMTINDTNRLKRRYNPWSVRPFPFVAEHVLFTGSELANMVHLPQLASDKVPEDVRQAIPHGVHGLSSLPDDVMVEETDLELGTMQHPVVTDRQVFIQSRFIGEHFVVTGNTGSGKSTVLNTLISKGFLDPFIAAKGKVTPGFTFIDPARDTAVTFYNWLLRAEAQGTPINWEKVHYFKIADGEYPIAMNLLGKIDGVSVDVQASAITEIIENSFENKAEVAVRLLRFCIKTLLADPQETHTILEVPYLLDDEDFRDKILSRLDFNEYYDLLNYWKTDAEENIKTSATAVKNRIDLFSTSTSMRRIFGQKDNQLQVKTYMDEGHICLFDLSNLSSKESTIISDYMSYLYYRTAETRNIGANLHLLLIDEAHRVGDVFILPKIVAESRKFGLALGISTQRLAQLSKELRDTLTEVQNNFFVCRQGSKDSKIAAENIGSDIVKPLTLEQLEKREVVVKYPFVYPNGKEEQQRFLVKVPPLDKYKEDGTVADFHDKQLIRKVDEWTMKRAEKMMADRGYQTSQQVDRQIFRYLNHEGSSKKEEKEKTTNSLFGV